MEQEWSSFWWNNITGANYLVSKVAETLSNNDPAVLLVPSDLPWRYQMRGAVEAAFRKNTSSSELIIDLVDAVDDCSSYDDPGRFLLEQYGQNCEVRNGYREKSKKTIQEYLLERNVLKNKIIWVKGLSGKQAKKWLSFCNRYTPDHSGQGQFVLEIHGQFDAKNQNTVLFEDYISKYDVQLFNSFILGTISNLSFGWRNYIATAAAALCDFDAEISERLISLLKYKTESPVDVLIRIAQLEQFLRRGREPGSRHILAYSRRNDISYLNQKLWSAQVRVLFPLIEVERINLISELEEQISNALAANEIIQYRERITDPFDVELGTLDFMMSQRSDNGLYILHVPQEEQREKIRFLHKCRNLLAHAETCTPNQVTQLLDKTLTH